VCVNGPCTGTPSLRQPADVSVLPGVPARLHSVRATVDSGGEAFPRPKVSLSSAGVGSAARRQVFCFLVVERKVVPPGMCDLLHQLGSDTDLLALAQRLDQGFTADLETVQELANQAVERLSAPSPCRPGRATERLRRRLRKRVRRWSLPPAVQGCRPPLPG